MQVNCIYNHHKIVSVAVAVLRYTDKFLVAKRHMHQHQGGKWEFIGGKIDSNESAKQALMREVNEEIGLSLNTDQLVFIGKVYHDYQDKKVCLYTYEVYLTKKQYHDFLYCQKGLENQDLRWLDMDEMIAKVNQFPVANTRIIDWIGLPNLLYISHAVDYFGDFDGFVNYYSNQLPKSAYFYYRPCVGTDDAIRLLTLLKSKRPDINLVVSWSVYQAAYHQDMMKVLGGVMVKLTCDELEYFSANFDKLPTDLPLWVGVHDKKEAMMANQLAKSHRIVAALISPVHKTKTHPKAHALGWQGFESLAKLCDMPSMALGGLTYFDMNHAKHHGAKGIAGIRGLILSHNSQHY